MFSIFLSWFVSNTSLDSLVCSTPPGVHLKNSLTTPKHLRDFFFRLTSQVLSGGNNSLARAGELSPNTKVKLSDQKSVTDSSAFQELGHPELDKSPALWFSCFEISILALPTRPFLPWHSCQRHSFCCNPGQFFLGVCIYLHTGQGTCFLDAGHLSVL